MTEIQGLTKAITEVGTFLLANHAGTSQEQRKSLRSAAKVGQLLAVDGGRCAEVYVTCGNAMWSTIVKRAENFWKMNFFHRYRQNDE